MGGRRSVCYLRWIEVLFHQTCAVCSASCSIIFALLSAWFESLCQQHVCVVCLSCDANKMLVLGLHGSNCCANNMCACRMFELRC